MYEANFWKKVRKTETCWEWTGSIATSGHGKYNNQAAHRVAWVLINGPLKSDEHLHHDPDICGNRACVNPDHMTVISPADHIRIHDPAKAKRDATHCKRGHPLTGDNLTPHDGRRKCRTCHNMRQREYARRKKGS